MLIDFQRQFWLKERKWHVRITCLASQITPMTTGAKTLASSPSIPLMKRGTILSTFFRSSLNGGEVRSWNPVKHFLSIFPRNACTLRCASLPDLTPTSCNSCSRLFLIQKVIKVTKCRKWSFYVFSDMK